MSVRRPLPRDGRHRRSLRTRARLIDAYIAVARERCQLPTALEVAERGGLSLRSVFQRFEGLAGLGLSAFDEVLRQPFEAPPPAALKADLATRIALHAAIRARTCETWLPMWRLVLQARCPQQSIAPRIAEMRRLYRERLELFYRRELDALPQSRRVATLIALEAVTDFEAWGRMRHDYGLSPEAARETWIETIGRLLPEPGNQH